MIIKYLHMRNTSFFIFLSVASLLARVQMISNYLYVRAGGQGECIGCKIKREAPKLSLIFNADLLDRMEVVPVCGLLFCSYFLTLQHFHSVCTENRAYMRPLADSCRLV